MNDDFLKHLKANQKHTVKGFSDIPDGYFENLKSTMQKRVETQNQGYIQWSRRFYGAAASLVFLLGLYFVWHFASTTNNQQKQLGANIFTTDTVSKEMIEDTLMNIKQDQTKDTLGLDEIPYEYLMLYLIENEEFEF